MEWGDEEAAQESTRRGPRQIGWFGSERSQKAGQPRKWPQGRPGQKPHEKNRSPAQRQTPTTGTPKEAVNSVISLICARYGALAIGRGAGGIRYHASH